MSEGIKLFPMARITITTDDLLSTEEARKVLGFSRVHIWRLIHQAHKLHPLYFGNRPYFAREEVLGLKKDKPTN